MAQEADLGVAGLLRDLLGCDVHALGCVERTQQADGERAGRAEARACRNVGQADDLDRRRNGMAAQRFAHDRMLDLVDRVDMLELGIFDLIARTKGSVDTDIDVLVDRR